MSSLGLYPCRQRQQRLRYQAPFVKCDNLLRLAEEKGLGTRDLSRIEVVGTPIREALCPYQVS